MENVIELTSAEVKNINGGYGSIVAPEEDGSHGSTKPFIVY